MFFISIVIGLILVISSLFLIRREFLRAINVQNQMLEQSSFYKSEDLFALLENLQLSVDTMNQSFYEIANDLEGKYSVHEKEIQSITEAIELIKRSVHAAEKKPITVEAVDVYNELSQNDIKSQIQRMLSEGKTPPQIAKELGIGYGELQLLMNLKK